MNDQPHRHPLPVDRPKILIVKMWDLGEILAATPLLRAIRKRYPNSEIHWLCDSAYALVLAANSVIDRVIAFDSSTWRSDLRWSRLVPYLRRSAWLRRELMDEHYDAVINLAAEHWWSVWFGVAPRRVGVFAGHRPGLMGCTQTDVIARTAVPRLHNSQHYLLSMDALDIAGPHDEHINLALTESDRRAAHDILRSDPAYISGRPIVILHPSAAQPSRRWPLSSFAALADSLAGYNIVVTGSSHDRILAERIAGMTRRRLIMAAGRIKGIGETAALVERARAVVTGDTSMLQIASALEVPVVGIYGSTRPADNAPLFGRSELLYNDEVDCAPCNRARCRLSEGDKITCLRSITVDHVIAALERLGVDPI